MKSPYLPDTQGFLAIAIIALIGIIIVLLMMHPITLDDKISGMLTMLIGVLTACLKDVYSYFFGSSKGSTLKDETIKAAIEAPAAQVVAQTAQTEAQTAAWVNPAAPKGN
jgi:hypothetical protein